jgi:N-acetylglucosamine-6-phosphate deacetylase
MTTPGGGREPLVRFKGGSVLHGDGTCRSSLVEGGDVWVRNGKVMDHMKLFYEERVSPSREIDCTGLIVAPGFIDIQINGKCIR